MTPGQIRAREPEVRGSTAVRGVSVLQHLLTELAHVLLPRGMTPKRFAYLVRSAFVQAAADISRLQNGRVNYSRIAAQTGLTRADVRRLLKHNACDATLHGQTALEKVIHGWRTDREFLTRDGQAKRLQITGARGSFTRLVRRHGGDVPPRAILDELRRIGAVSDHSGSVQLKNSPHVRERLNFTFLAPVVPALVDGLQIAAKLNRSSITPAIQRLSIPAKTELDLAILRERCKSGAQSMLEGLAHSLGRQIAVPKKKGPPDHWLTITVLMAESRSKKARGSRWR
jgi:Family of unknown function (DUF6502)